MNIGELRHLIVVEVNQPIRDAAGQGKENWKKFRDGMFSIETMGGTETARGGQIEATGSHLLKCRYFPGATPRMRLRFGTRIFHVVSVDDEDERGRWLVWDCNEVK